MYCDNCFRACGIVSCYSNIYVGKTDYASENLLVVIENISTGRRVSEQVTTDGDGVVLLTSGTFRKFLTGSSTYKIRIFRNGVNIDLKMYLTSTTFDTTDYNCITFDTYTLRESDGNMYVMPTQYLFKSQ